MPPTNEHPEKLRPYIFHRVNLSYSGTADAVGDCPFCGKEKKFFIDQKQGLYHCKVGCDGGNVYTFLRKLYPLCSAPQEELEMIAEERKIEVDTLRRWGLVKSQLDGEWMLPAYSQKKEINNLYRWTRMKQKDGSWKRRLLTTATLPHGIFGFHLWDPKKMNVAVLEGPWDGMRLEEELRKYRNNQGKAVRTTDTEQSLLSQWNVIALPGVDVFREDWIPLFKGKTVAWLFDNDHPRLNVKTGEVLEPPGLKGALKNAKMVSKVVKSQQIIQWGASELLDQELPDGFDVRDFLSFKN